MEEKPINGFMPADIEAFRVVRRELLQQALLTLKRVAELEAKAREVTDRKEGRQLELTKSYVLVRRTGRSSFRTSRQCECSQMSSFSQKAKLDCHS